VFVVFCFASVIVVNVCLIMMHNMQNVFSLVYRYFLGSCWNAYLLINASGLCNARNCLFRFVIKYVVHMFYYKWSLL